jgi:hypothetical protein
LSRAQTAPRGSDNITGEGQSVFSRRLAVAVALIAGVIGSQGPEFAEQYRQRMGGALDELKRIVAQFDAAAAREGLTTAQAVGWLEQNAEPLAREQGQNMVETIARADRLEEEFEAMRSAGPLKRIYVMAKDFDPEIARHTLDNYEPAAPLSFEAVIVAGLAAISGWVATHLVAWPIPRARRPPRPATIESPSGITRKRVTRRGKDPDCASSEE